MPSGSRLAGWQLLYIYDYEYNYEWWHAMFAYLFAECLFKIFEKINNSRVSTLDWVL